MLLVQRADYSLDGDRWQTIYPKDGIADSRVEQFELVLEEAAARGVIVRAADALNNVSSARGRRPSARRPDQAVDESRGAGWPLSGGAAGSGAAGFGFLSRASRTEPRLRSNQARQPSSWQPGSPCPPACRQGLRRDEAGLVYGVEQRHLLRRDPCDRTAIGQRRVVARKQFGIRQASITADHGAERVITSSSGICSIVPLARIPSCSLSRGNEMPLSAGRSGRDSEPGLPRAEIIAASESGS